MKETRIDTGMKTEANTKVLVNDMVVMKQPTGNGGVMYTVAFRCLDNNEPLDMSMTDSVDLVLERGGYRYAVIGAEVGMVAIRPADDKNPDGYVEGKAAGGTYRVTRLDQV